jgi:hypothetical protein
MRPPGLRRLMVAAELCRDRDLAVLKRIDAELAALRAEADALRAAGSGGAALLAMRGEAARLAASWEALREGKLAALGLRMAELAARRDAARMDVARSSGRVTVVRKLDQNRGGRGQAS